MRSIESAPFSSDIYSFQQFFLSLLSSGDWHELLQGIEQSPFHSVKSTFIDNGVTIFKMGSAKTCWDCASKIKATFTVVGS